MQTSMCKAIKKEIQNTWEYKDVIKLQLIYSSFVKFLVPCSSDDVHFMNHSILN